MRSCSVMGRVGSGAGLLCSVLLFCCQPGLAVSYGDLIVTDTHHSSGHGTVDAVDPRDGTVTVVASGGFLDQPDDICLDPTTGTVIVSDYGGIGAYPNGRILRIDPFTGQQTVLASGGSLLHPTAVALDGTGHLLVAQAGAMKQTSDNALLRIDLATGAQTVVATGAELFTANGIVAPSVDRYYLSKFQGPPALVEITADGSQRVISTFDIGPEGLCLDVTHPGDALVIVTRGNNTTVPALYRVDLATGEQTLLATGGQLTDPTDVTQDPSGNIYVTNLGYNGLNDVLKIDPFTGAQSVVAAGGALVGASDLVVLAAPLPKAAMPMLVAGAVALAYGRLLGRTRRPAASTKHR